MADVTSDAEGAEKPTWEQFPNWLKERTDKSHWVNIKARHETVATKIKSDIEGSPLWRQILSSLQEVGDTYTLGCGYILFASAEPPILNVKPYASILDKTYRKNIINNKSWPNPPSEGWLTPENWYERLNDVVRTTLVVKYLDGVQFLVQSLEEIANSGGYRFEVEFEARDEGYYAAHCALWFEVDVPRIDWDTQRISALLEIQVTTQLQDVIRKLTHDYYEERRSKSREGDRKWQWDYSSAEFVPNYLGHILHYVEGMIMEVRSRRSAS